MTRVELRSQSLLTTTSLATLALLTLASVSAVREVMDIAAKGVLQKVSGPVDEGTFAVQAWHCAGTGKLGVEGRRQGFVGFDDDGVHRFLGHDGIFGNHRFDRFLGFFRDDGHDWFFGFFRDDGLDGFRRLIRLDRFFVILGIRILWSRLLWLCRFDRGIWLERFVFILCIKVLWSRFLWLCRFDRSIWLDWCNNFNCNI